MAFILPLCSSASIGIFKQNQDVELYQVCNNCTYCNFTSVKYPNSTNILTNAIAESDGTRYYYNLNGANTSTLGIYSYCYDCGNTVESVTGCLDFEVTPSGSGEISTGNGIIIIGFSFLMIVIGVAFFIIAFKISNTVGKIGFFVFSVIIFIMAVLFMVVSAQQNLYGYENIVSGTETFLFVLKMLLTVGILAFFIIIALVMLKLWKIKRGYIDY